MFTKIAQLLESAGSWEVAPIALENQRCVRSALFHHVATGDFKTELKEESRRVLGCEDLERGGREFPHSKALTL